VGWLDIFEYIAADNPRCCSNRQRYISEDTSVSEFSRDGPSILGISRHVRILLYGHYRIAYLIKDDGNVDVLGVFHGSLDSPNISSDGT
jgi:plasmid stabilization system protein ParE